MISAFPIRRYLLIIILIVIIGTVSCVEEDWRRTEPTDAPKDWGQHAPWTDIPNNAPPGNDEPGADQVSPLDPTPAGVQPTVPATGNTTGSLKPVKFSNVGTVAYTVSTWTYTPLYTTTPSIPSDASTVASPGGNPSSYLSLPMGTYTWCFHWEQGDINGDGTIDYAHAIDGRPIKLDETSSDDLDFAQVVTLSAPTTVAEMPGTCTEAGSAAATISPRPPVANGELLFSDNGSGAKGMFGPEYMDYSFENGQGQLTANASNFVLPAMYSGQTYGDAIFEVDFTGFNAGGGGEYSIIFRSDDVDGGLASYNIISLIPGSRTIAFAVWQEGWTNTIVAPITDESISLAAPVHFRLEARGGEYAAYINGTFAAGFQESQITSPGIMGMSITTDSAPGSYTFNNLNIYALP